MMGLSGVDSVGAARPNLELTPTTLPVDAVPGSSGSVSLTLKNVGTLSANGMTVRVIQVQGVMVNDTARVQLGSLGVGDQSTVTPFTFWTPEDTRPGVYLGTFALDYYYEEQGTTKIGSITFSVPFTVRVPRALHVGPLDPSELEPGAAKDLQLSLRNTGKTAITNLQGFWSNPEGVLLPLGQGTEVFIAQLAAGTTVNAPVEIAVPPDAKAGLYSITFTFTYRDVGGAQSSSTSHFAVQVRTPSELRVALDEWELDEVTLSVSNVGLGPASAVEIRIQDGPVDVRPAAAVFLGNLAPGDHTTATFSPASINGKDVPLHAIVSYTDPDGVRHETTHEMDLGSTPTDETEGGTVTLVLILALLAAVGLGAYFYMRRRKRK